MRIQLRILFRRLASLHRKACLRDIDQRAEFVHITVSVAVERVECVDIERSARGFARKRPFLVFEVVVAVDQYPRGLFGDDPGQLLSSNVRKAQILGALNVE